MPLAQSGMINIFIKNREEHYKATTWGLIFLPES